MDERIHVEIVNVPLAHKRDEYEDYEKVQHGLFSVVLHDDSKVKSL